MTAPTPARLPRAGPDGYNRAMGSEPPLRAALVHDWLNQDGGAEAVLGVLHDLFPTAPVVTTIADPERVPGIAGWDVRTSWMNRLPGIHGHHQPYLPLYPLAWQSTRLRGYELVLSNKSGFCHGVDAGPATHVCYCLTPTRFVWEPETYLRYEPLPRGAGVALRALLPFLRRWDRRAADGVDRFVAISRAVQARIQRVYARPSEVIHPPVDMAPPPAAGPGDYYLVLSRLVPYKRIDLAVAAFNRLGRRLVIVGDGRDRSRLAAAAGGNVELRGRLPRAEVLDLVAGCRGLVWPGIEDFGLAPVEVMSAGRPVIARRGGGALDTVTEGRTGVFFDEPTPEALAAAVARAETIVWDPDEIRRRALRFSRSAFERALGRVVDDVRASRTRAAMDRTGAAERMKVVPTGTAGEGRRR